MRHLVMMPALAVFCLAACGGSSPQANDPTEATSGGESSGTDEPGKDKPKCEGLDRTACKITVGCAWTHEDTCVEEGAI